MRYLFSFIFVFTLFQIASCKLNDPSVNEEKKSGFLSVQVNTLLVREKPTRESKILWRARKGDLLEVFENTGNTETIQNVQGGWKHVRDNAYRNGYVFDAYLGPFKDSAEFAWNQIHEENGVVQAINQYQSIIQKFPDATKPTPHGIFQYSGLAQTRIQVLKCIDDPPENRSSTVDELESRLSEALANNSPDSLVPLLACDYSITVGPLTLQSTGLQAAHDTLEYRKSINTETSVISSQSIQYDLIQKESNNPDFPPHDFYFVKDGNNYIITHFSFASM